MYISKLKKYITYFKIYSIIYLIIFLCSLFCISYTKSLIIFFNLSTIIYILFISQKTFLEQDKYIENNYNDIYKRYNFVCVRPIAITFRELTKKNGFLPSEIVDLLVETKKMLRFFFKLFCMIFANTFFGGYIYIIITRT